MEASSFQQFSITLVLALAGSLAVLLAIRKILPRYVFEQTKPSVGWISRRSADRAFFLLTCCYVVIFSALSIQRHLSFNSGGFDLGVFDQAIWNSLNGRLLSTSLIYDTPTLLGQRFSPILLAFVPLYAIWSNPIALLVSQTLVLAAPAFPIYWLARERLGNALALIIAAAYFLSPTLEFVNLYDFHEVALVACIFAFAVYLLLHRSYRGFLVCLGLALLAKEEVAFSLVAFGVYLFFVDRKRWLGLALSAFGLLWGWVLLLFLIPFFRGPEYGSDYYYFGHGLGAGSGAYDYLGNSLTTVVTSIFTRPEIVLQQVLVPAKGEFVLHFLVPLAFLPLVAPEIVVLAMPTLGIILLSAEPYRYSIYFHHGAPLIPFVFFAAVIGLERALRSFDAAVVSLHVGNPIVERTAIRWAAGALIVIASGLSYYFQAPGPYARRYAPSSWPSVTTDYTIDAHTMVGYELLRMIPSDASVLAQHEFASHLSDRQFLYEPPRNTDYRLADYIILDASRWGYQLSARSWEELLATGYFETVVRKDGYLLARRRPIDSPAGANFDDVIKLLGSALSITNTQRGGQTYRPVLMWQAEKPISERYSIEIKVLDTKGHLWARQDREPLDGNWPTTRWSAGRTIGDQYDLRLPPTLPAGEYQVKAAIHLVGSDTYLQAYGADHSPLGTEVVIGSLHLEKDKSSVEARDLWIEQPLFVDMGEMRFLGSVPPRQIIKAGELFQVGLYWRARAKPLGNYETIVQLRDKAGNVSAEHAQLPADGAYPTTQWVAGEVLLDWHDFQLPDTIPAGEYNVLVSLREVTGKRELGSTTIAKISVVR